MKTIKYIFYVSLLIIGYNAHGMDYTAFYDKNLTSFQTFSRELAFKLNQIQDQAERDTLLKHARSPETRAQLAEIEHNRQQDEEAYAAAPHFIKPEIVDQARKVRRPAKGHYTTPHSSPQKPGVSKPERYKPVNKTLKIDHNRNVIVPQKEKLVARKLSFNNGNNSFAAIKW